MDGAREWIAVLIEAIVLGRLVDHALGLDANLFGRAFDGGEKIPIELLGSIQRVREIAHRGRQTRTILKETFLDERSHLFFLIDAPRSIGALTRSHLRKVNVS